MEKQPRLAAALNAFYGRWPVTVTVTATNRSSNRTLVTIGRDRMQYLIKAQGALLPPSNGS